MRTSAHLGKGDQFKRGLNWVISALVCLCVAPHVTIFTLQHLNGVPVWLAELSRFIPYYWLLAPAVFAIGLALLLPIGWVILTLCNVIALATITMGFQWNTPNLDAPVGARLRVLSFNDKGFPTFVKQKSIVVESRSD